MDNSGDLRKDSVWNMEDMNKQLEQNFMEFIQHKEEDLEPSHNLISHSDSQSHSLANTGNPQNRHSANP